MFKNFIKKMKQKIVKIPYLKETIFRYAFLRVFINVLDAITVRLVNRFIRIDTIRFSFKAKKLVAQFVVIPLHIRKIAALRGGFCLLSYILAYSSQKTLNFDKVKYLRYCCHLSNIGFLCCDGDYIISILIISVLYFPKSKSKKEYLE